MLIGYKLGQGSIILRVKLRNSSVSTGAGLTGLTSASSGLRIATAADNEQTSTAYTVAGSTIETITTLGTYAAPTATKCRFKEYDATNHPGIYEVQIADARYAVSNAKSIMISINGATNLVECDVVIPLRSLDPYDAVRAGLTALPNVASGSAGAIITSGSGTAQLNVASGNLSGTVTALVTSMGNSLMSALKNGKTFYNAVSTTPASAGLFVPYQTTSIYNTDWAYLNTTTNYLLWWDSSNSLWTISTTLGTRGTNYWTCATMAGTYTAGGSASGSPILISKADPFDANYSNASYLSDGCANANVVKALGTLITCTTSGVIDVNSVRFGNQTLTVSAPVTVPALIASTTNITAGTMTTTTNLTNLPSVPTDWLTAAGVSAGAVTKVQTGLATPTNITAATGVVLSPVTHTGATIPTVTTVGTTTNLTNAPTSGDFTATMKTSLNSATPAVTVSDKTGFSLTSAYDSAKTAASETNATTNKNTIVAAIGTSSSPTAVQIRQEIDSNSTQLQTIAAAVSGSVSITVVNPLSSDGTELQLVTGDSYTSANGLSLKCLITGQTGLIGSTPHLCIQDTTLCTAPTITSGTQQIVFNDVTSTQTSYLQVGVDQPYQIRFVGGSDTATPITGLAQVIKGQSL